MSRINKLTGEPNLRWGKLLTITIMTMFVLIQSAQAYTVVDDYVYEDNADVYIRTSPHTFTPKTEYIYFNFMSKRFTGDVDMVWGFDTDRVQPKQGLFWNGLNWTDVTDRFQTKEVQYQGMNRWYVSKNIPVIEDTMYNMKVKIKIKKPSSGKYWVCLKPSAENIQDAISSGHFYCLDPWWNANYLYKRAIFGNISANSADYELPVLINVTFNGSKEFMTCDMTVTNTNATWGFIYYNNYTDYVCTNATESNNVSTQVELGNGSTYSSMRFDNLLIHWTGESTTESSKYGNVGTLIGSPTGKKGGCMQDSSCYQFDKANEEFFNFSTPTAISGKSAMSVCAWVYRRDLSSACVVAAAHDRGDCNSGSGFGIVDAVVNKHTGVVCVGGTTYTVDSSANAIADIWEHVCLTYDGNVLTLYVDAVSQGTNNGMSGAIDALNSDDYFAIGCSKDDRSPPVIWDYGPCNGSIDNVMLWNETLTLEKIRAIYYMQSGHYSLSSEANYSAVTHETIVTEPTNKTYQHNPYQTISIDLSYYANPPYDCVTSQYSLDSAANVSLGCANTSFTVSDYGPHWVTVYTQGTGAGNKSYEQVHFSLNDAGVVNLKFTEAVDVKVMPEGTSETILNYTAITSLTITESQVTEGNTKVTINDTQQVYEFLSSVTQINDTLKILNSTTDNTRIKIITQDETGGGSRVDEARLRVWYSELGNASWQLIDQIYTDSQGEAEIWVPPFSDLKIVAEKDGYNDGNVTIREADKVYSESEDIYIKMSYDALQINENITYILLEPATSVIQEIPTDIRISIASSVETNILVRASVGGSYNSTLQDSCDDCQELEYVIENYNTNSNITIEIYTGEGIVLQHSITFSIEDEPRNIIDPFSEEGYRYYQGVALLFIIGSIGLTRLLGGEWLAKERIFALLAIGSIAISSWFIYVGITGALILLKDLTDYLRRD